ncbi:unnamed protein product [Staurois parvus]|uniref:MRH domain-containing protein n=1 Tax=Staurois parvus TaxID=386267 RepID=A0ABN9AK44_9NEOB|nr:unnamed protein product [Staurois parvus]
MKYDQGTGCWQGPNRSTLVKLFCGKETVIMSTSEPSRCEYLMEFYTPASCQQPAGIPQPEEHEELCRTVLSGSVSGGKSVLGSIPTIKWYMLVVVQCIAVCCTM